MKGAGVAAGTAALPGTGAAIDDAIDLDGGLQEVVVVFEDREDAAVLDRFDLPAGYHTFEALPYAYTKATGAVVERIADRPEVRWIDYNHEIELHNDNARELTGAEEVHADLDVTGDGVHVALIDSGLSPHPDIVDRIEHNYKFVNPLGNYSGESIWVDAAVADTDDYGHGTHVSGTLGGDGEASDGEYRGIAPGVDAITSYRVDGPRGLFLHVVAALDHLLAMQRDGEVDVQLINNSWGWSRWGDFNPTNAVNYGFWELFTEGVLPLFSAGNDYDLDTMSPYARAPYVACIAATHTDASGTAKAVTSFSSAGRPPEEDKGATYARGFEMSYDDNEGAQYDRKLALRNVRKFYAEEPTDAPPVEHDYVESFESDVPAGSYTPVGSVHLEAAETVEWESPPDAGLLSATVTWEPRNQSIEVSMYPTDNPDNEIGGPYPANINDGRAVIEFDVPIDPETSYTFEFRGQGNVDATATVELEVLEDVSAVDGPFGVYRPAVGAPGDSIVSAAYPHSVMGSTGLVGADPDDPQGTAFYAPASGTSMSCPVATGVAALIIEAYEEAAGFKPKPIDVLNILEVTAEGGTEAERPGHHQASIGAGFVDAVAAVETATVLGEQAAGWDGHPSDDPAVASHPELWGEIQLCSFEARR